MRGRRWRCRARVAGQSAAAAATTAGTGQAHARSCPRHADHDLDKEIRCDLQRAAGIEMAGFVERDIAVYGQFLTGM